jgi:hypothetical protein
MLGKNLERLFLFLYFSKKNYKNIFFDLGLQFYTPTARQGGRQGAYRPAGGR